MNLAFSFAGLKALGITPADLSKFPQAFSDGMKARAARLATWVRVTRESGSRPSRAATFTR